MFNQMVAMGDYYASGRPVYVNPEIIVSDISSKIPLCENDIILDVGCGTGLLTTILARLCKYVHALDPARMALARLEKNCEEKWIHNVAIHEGMATDLPFADQTFDKVIMYAVIHYLGEKKMEKCIRELIRVCKTGGYVFVGEIPEKRAKEEFDLRVRTNEELRILEEFGINRKQYDRLFKETVSAQGNDKNHSFRIDGNFLIEIAEKEGCTAEIYKQDIRQPFSLTRRDLVIHRLA